jgi:hypothetical protein
MRVFSQPFRKEAARPAVAPYHDLGMVGGVEVKEAARQPESD